MMTVSLTRFSALPDERCGFVCRRVAVAEGVGSALFAESQRERIAELFVLCFQVGGGGGGSGGGVGHPRRHELLGGGGGGGGLGGGDA